MKTKANISEFSGLALLILCVNYLPAALAMPITYELDRTLRFASVTGTVTTDGTLGHFGEENVLSWNIKIDDGSDTMSFDSTQAESRLIIEGSMVAIATVESLIFDFTAPDGFGIQFQWYDLEFRWLYSLDRTSTSEWIGHLDGLTPIHGIIIDREFEPLIFAEAVAIVDEPGILTIFLVGLLMTGSFLRIEI